MILTGDSFILTHGFSSENLNANEVKNQRKSQESRESRPRSLDSARSLELYQSTHIQRKETKKYSSALAEVCPVRERDIRRKTKCIKKEVRHVKEVNRFNGVMHVSTSLSKSDVPRFLQPLKYDSKDEQTKMINHQQERALNMTNNDLEASTTKKILEKEQLDEKSYRDHLYLEILKWLQSMPILFSPNFTREYLRDNVAKELVEKIEKHTLEASSGVNEAHLKNEIDDCVSSLPIRLPNNQEDRRLFKNGLREYIYTNIVKLWNKIFVKRDGINNEKRVEYKHEKTNFGERKGLKEYEKYCRNRDMAEKGLEAIEIEIKSISNFRETDNIEIKQDKVEEIKRSPTTSTKNVNDVDDLYENEINIWLDRMNYNKTIPRKLTVKLIIKKIKPFLNVPVYSINYKLKCSGAIIDMFKDFQIQNEFPIKLINPRIKTVYLNKLAMKLAKRLMIVKVNSHLKELIDIQQCDEKLNDTLSRKLKEVINKKPEEENLQARVQNKGVLFENLQVTETNRLLKRQNDSIHNIQEQILNDINDDYMHVKAQNIAKDEDELETWTAKLLEEQKNMVREGKDLLKLSKALVYERLSYVPYLISYEREILKWLQSLPLLPLCNEHKEQRRIMQMISKLSEKIIKRNAIRNSDLNDNTIQYITDFISNLALDPSKPIIVPILVQQLMNRIDEIYKKDVTSDVTQLVEGNISKCDENAALTMSIERYAANCCNTRPTEVESPSIRNNISTENINKEIVSPEQFHLLPCSPYKEPGDLIVELVEDWCNELPIIGDQLQKQIIVDHTSTKVVMKICELNMDTKIFNNDIIYDQKLDRELTNITSNLPASVDFKQTLPVRNYKLLQMIKPVKAIIKERKQWLEYETKLNDTVIHLFNYHQDTKGKDAAFNKLKVEIIDNFVQYLYNNNEEEAKISYKKNIHKYITDIKGKGKPVDPVVRQNQLLCELLKIPIPNNNILKEKVEEIKMKNEVERLFNENGFNDNTNKTFQIKNTLAKILNVIEKSGHTKCNDKKMKDAVVKYLKKLDKKLGSQVIYNFVNHLKYNEAARKTPPLNRNKTKSIRLDSDAGALFSSTPLTYPISRQQQTTHKPLTQPKPIPQYPNRDPSNQSNSHHNEYPNYPSEPQSPTAPGSNNSKQEQIFTSANQNNKIFGTEQSQKVTPQPDIEVGNLKPCKHTYARTSQRCNVRLKSDISHTLNHPNSNLHILPEHNYRKESINKPQTGTYNYLSASESNQCQFLQHEDFNHDNVLNSSKLVQNNKDPRGLNKTTSYNQIATPHCVESNTQTSDSDIISERTLSESPAPESNTNRKVFNYSQIATSRRFKCDAQTSDFYDSCEKSLPEFVELKSKIHRQQPEKTARALHNFHALKEQKRLQDFSNEKRYCDTRSKKFWSRMPSVIEETQTSDSFNTEKSDRCLNYTNANLQTTIDQNNYIERWMVGPGSNKSVHCQSITELENLKMDCFQNSFKLHTQKSANQRLINKTASFKQIETPRRVIVHAQNSNISDRTLPELLARDLSAEQKAFNKTTSYEQIATLRRDVDETKSSDSYNTYERTHLESSISDLNVDQRTFNKATSYKQISILCRVVDETQASDSYNTYEKTLPVFSATELNADPRETNDATTYKRITTPRRVEAVTQTSDSYNTYERTLPKSPDLRSNTDRQHAESQEQWYSLEQLSQTAQTPLASSAKPEQTYASSAKEEKYEDFKRGNILNSTKLSQNQSEFNDSTTYKKIAIPRRVEVEGQTLDPYNTYERTLPESNISRSKTSENQAESHKRWYSLESSSQTAQTPLVSSSIPEQTYASSTNQEKYENFKRGNLLNSTKLDSTSQREFNDATTYKQFATPRRVEDETQTSGSYNSNLGTLPASLESDLTADQRAFNGANTYKLIESPHKIEGEAQTSDSYNASKRTLPESSAPDLSQDQRAFSDATTYKQIATLRRAKDEAQTSDSYNTYERTLPESSASDLSPGQRAFSDATTYKQIATPRRAVDEAQTIDSHNGLNLKKYSQQPESIARKVHDSKEQKRKSQELSSVENFLCFRDRPLKKLCSRMYCVIPLDNCRECGEVHPNRCSCCRLPRTEYMHCTWDSR